MRTTSSRSVQVFALACVFLLASAGELAARGGRGGGRMGGGGFSRGGMARGGSMGGYSAPRSRSTSVDHRSSRDRSTDREQTRSRSGTESGDSWTREGSRETRRGETVDWESEITRTDEGFRRETSWESTSGASGSGSSNVRVEGGRVQGADRTSHVDTASGETIDRTVSSRRDGDWVVREGSINTSTGVDADTASAIQRTHDGYVAHGAVSGKRGDAAGTIVKSGDDIYARGARVQGDDVTWGRIHCDGRGHCTGGRVTADLDDYYDYPYYYYPYYYGWYSCPYGTVQSWPGAYGTPVYGCSNVTVVQTTVSLGPSTTSYASSPSSPSSPSRSASSPSPSSGPAERRSSGSVAGSGSSSEARVTSRPVLMYEIDPSLSVYSSDERPAGVYSVQKGKRHFWTPGPKDGTPQIDAWLTRASAMSSPTANATVITYTIGSRLVYLTNEPPAPGYFSETSDQLFAWMPGVRQPNDAEKEAIGTAIAAHRAGGRQALDREARKLEKGRQPPPQTVAKPAP